jgi:phospholipid/cholesterol/gamma-HCH transport system substrate-binding protein
METRANYLVVALFTLGVVVSAMLFVLWFSGAESGPKRRVVTVAFEDSIAGLAKGSAVDFNGIRVGDVTRIYFDPKDTSKAYAEVAIDWATPVRADTRAGLNVGTLSGSGRISLMGGSPDAPELAAANSVIFAQPSGLAAVLETSKGLTAKA